jgi:hypothetical protein
MDETKYILYLDNLQRLIMGEEITEESKEQPFTGVVTLKRTFVKNPVILHVQTTGTNINIQFFPIMFKEFLADKDQATEWDITDTPITRCKEIPLDARLISQYKHIFSPVKNAVNMAGMMPQSQPIKPVGEIPAPMPQNPNVIKLFDDKPVKK